MTITMRKMISASTALVVIWLPQVGLTKFGVMLAAGMWKDFSSAVATLSVMLTGEVGSAFVVTSHCVFRYGEELICTVESPPPAAVTTREISPWTWGTVPWLVEYGNWK